MAEDRSKRALVLGGTGAVIGVAALIAALTKKVEAAPEDQAMREALAAILTLAEDSQLKLDTLPDIEAKSDAIIGALESLGLEVPLEKRIEQIPFAYNLAELQGVVLTEVTPFPGYIKQVSIHFPEGCNALVDVKVGRGVEQFCPNDGYLSLNDATPTYPFNVEVKAGEEIWVEMINTDGVNPHAITVTISLEGVA